MRDLYKLFVMAVLAVFCVGAWAQVVIEQDDFTDPAGNMSPANMGENVNPGWRWNETAGLTPPAYDGTTSLLMDMNGAWDQYIDTQYGSAATLMSKDVALVAIFTAPADAGIAIGYTDQGGGWPDNLNTLIKVDGGNLLVSDDHISAASNLATGQAYVAGTPQGVMLLLSDTGNVTVHYQNGSDPSPTAAGWVDITPASDPEGILTFVYGPGDNNKIGVNAYGNASSQFQLDYIGLLDLTPPPPPEPEYLKVLEDNFDGTAGNGPDAAKWIEMPIGAAGTFDSTLDGSGVLVMPNPNGGSHNDPAIMTGADTVGGAPIFRITGATDHYRITFRAEHTGVLAVYGISNYTNPGGNPFNIGSTPEGRAFIPQPNGANPTATMSFNLGANTISASAASNGAGTLSPGEQTGFFGMRMTLDPTVPGGGTGSITYEVQKPGGSTWIDITPVGGSFNTYDTTLDYVLYVESQGFSGGASQDDVRLDSVLVEDLNQVVPVELSDFSME
jgi:hypothetical protein